MWGGARLEWDLSIRAGEEKEERLRLMSESSMKKEDVSEKMYREKDSLLTTRHLNDS